MDNKNIVLTISQKLVNNLRDKPLRLFEAVRGFIFRDGSAEEDGAERKRRLEYSAAGTGAAALSFLLSSAHAVMGSYPFGAAFLCSSGKYTVFAYIGALISTLFLPEGSLANFCIYTIIFGTRFLICRFVFSGSSPLFGEKAVVRAVLGCAAGCAVGAVKLILGGFLFYDLFGLLFSVAAIPLLTLLYDGINSENRAAPRYKAALAGFVLSAVFALGNYTVFGFSLSAVAAFCITMYAAKEAGAAAGGITGLLCGLAGGGPTALAVAGLGAGLSKKAGAVTAVSTGTVLGIACGSYLGGFEFFKTVGPDILAGTVIFMPLAHFGVLPKTEFFKGEAPTADDGIFSGELKIKNSAEKLSALSEAFSSLAEMFSTVSERMRRPNSYEIRRMCEDTFDRVCGDCKKRLFCRTRLCENNEALEAVSRAVFKNGTVSVSDLPKELSERCDCTEKLAAAVNLSGAELLERAVKRDRTEIFAVDYEAMAKLLSKAAAENDPAKNAEFERDPVLEGKIREAAEYIGLSAASVTVYGRRCPHIIAGGVELGRVRASAADIKTAFGNICGCEFSAPEFSVDNDYVTMTMSALPHFYPEHAKAGAVKDGEDISGDIASFFKNGDGYFYSLVSDGMGSGREAALTSRICGIFLEKMLSAGNAVGITLEMLNNFVRSKSTECFATVDLMEIDLYSGRAAFTKSGAAPSYILRDGNLFKISSKTMPIGITREITAEDIKFALEQGDVVVMVSDGAADTFEDGGWLANMLCYEWNENRDLQDMADKILDAAMTRDPGRDDMTVAVVRIN